MTGILILTLLWKLVEAGVKCGQPVLIMELHKRGIGKIKAVVGTILMQRAMDSKRMVERVA